MIPLLTRSKKPMFNDWTNINRADVPTVERWWASTPNANVGILTGVKSGLFVFDIDPKNGGNDTYSDLLAKHGQMPDTWEVITGSGGRHCYFRYPAFPVRNVAGLFGPTSGIDIRGDGGQVVAPPSIHPETGKTYEWDGLRDIESFKFAEAPAWLLEALEARGRVTPQNGRVPVKLVPEKIPGGTRNHALVAMAGNMRRMGLTAEEIFPSLQFVNQTRCDPPEDLAAVHQISQSMMRYRPQDNDLFNTSARLWRLTKKHELEAEEKLVRLKLEPQDGLSVYRSQLTGPAPVIDRMLYNGLTILAGKSKAGKSWIAMQLALSTAMHTSALGERQVLRPGGVVYYSLEMGENRTAARLRQLMASEDITLQNIEFVWDCLPMAAGGMDQLSMLLETKRPSLVVIDTFMAFAKGKQKESGDVMRGQYGEMDLLKKLSEKHETALLLVHHTRKTGAWDTGDEGVDLVAGSRGVTAACDSVWILRKQPDDLFALDITGRDVEEQSLAVKFGKDPLGWVIIGDADSVKRGNEDSEILSVVSSEGHVTIGKICSTLRMQRPKAQVILQRLNQSGMVGKKPNGTYYIRTDESEGAPWSN